MASSRAPTNQAVLIPKHVSSQDKAQHHSFLHRLQWHGNNDDYKGWRCTSTIKTTLRHCPFAISHSARLHNYKMPLTSSDGDKKNMTHKTNYQLPSGPVGAAPPTRSQFMLQRHTQVPVQVPHIGCHQPTLLDPLLATVCQASPFPLKTQK